MATQDGCEVLGIARPCLEAVKGHREANTFALLLVALLERGEAVTLNDIATRFEEAGIVGQAGRSFPCRAAGRHGSRSTVKGISSRPHPTRRPITRETRNAPSCSMLSRTCSGLPSMKPSRSSNLMALFSRGGLLDHHAAPQIIQEPTPGDEVDRPHGPPRPCRRNHDGLSRGVLAPWRKADRPGGNLGEIESQDPRDGTHEERTFPRGSTIQGNATLTADRLLMGPDPVHRDVQPRHVQQPVDRPTRGYYNAR